jgi:hypothetical protein
LIGRMRADVSVCHVCIRFQRDGRDETTSLRAGLFPDAIPWRGNGFASAAGTTTGAREPGSIAKGIRTVLAV